MKLIDLHPEWVCTGGEGVTDGQGNAVPYVDKAGIEFDCPCGNNDRYHRLFVRFRNPINSTETIARPSWIREGESFAEISLTPSILRAKINGGCGWHGYLQRGILRGQIE